MLGNEMIYRDLLFLPYTVSTVGGLLLDGRIPPRVKMNDIIGPRQIESQSSGLKADEKYLRPACLELFHHLGAFTDGSAAV